MEKVMQSNITEFVLLNFSDLPSSLQAALFMFFLSAYILTLVGNGLIMLTISLQLILKTPMYLFLRNLSFHELCLTTVTVPKVLENFLHKERSVPFLACASQMFMFFTIGISECVFLGVMAFDRYMAICHPLSYMSVMTTKLCYELILSSWIVGCLISLGQTIFIFSLPYCGCNRIPHFFCDIPPLLKLACTNIFMNELTFFIASIFGTIPFLLIICSYIKILISILAIHSSEGRHKALSTCSSHLVSVILFYSTAMFTYLRLGTYDSDRYDRMISLFYCLVVPTINPLIYSLRNKEMKDALRKMISKMLLAIFSIYNSIKEEPDREEQQRKTERRDEQPSSVQIEEVLVEGKNTDKNNGTASSNVNVKQQNCTEYSKHMCNSSPKRNL
ncbi:olfactory receptor 10AG1-like [Hyperolius riggenbachi]|uniref:olfactory receptor 10AG1-like n=1 Tax=Hyperolius riggenbachi TaxID=752182 RepID=UPI0035A26D95